MDSSDFYSSSPSLFSFMSLSAGVLLFITCCHYIRTVMLELVLALNRTNHSAKQVSSCADPAVLLLEGISLT
jgi:hypothetical protein